MIDKIRERLQEQAERYQKSLEGQHCIDYRWIDEEGLQATEDAIDIINQVEAEYNNGWISVDDRLPEELEEVIACDSREDVFIAYHMGNGWKYDTVDGEYHTIEVVAWMPFPEPYIPKKPTEPEWKSQVMNHFTKGE